MATNANIPAQIAPQGALERAKLNPSFLIAISAIVTSLLLKMPGAALTVVHTYRITIYISFLIAIFQLAVSAVSLALTVRLSHLWPKRVVPAPELTYSGLGYAAALRSSYSSV
jgi:hypothetical protein